MTPQPAEPLGERLGCHEATDLSPIRGSGDRERGEAPVDPDVALIMACKVWVVAVEVEVGCLDVKAHIPAGAVANESIHPPRTKHSSLLPLAAGVPAIPPASRSHGERTI
jgi:hypothetical protein